MAWSSKPIDIPARWPDFLLDYAPALAGVMFALLFFVWTPLRRSGQWVWVSVVLFELRFGLRQELSGRTPLDIAVNTPVVACILYSLTMFLMNQKLKRSESQEISASEYSGPPPSKPGP